MYTKGHGKGSFPTSSLMFACRDLSQQHERVGVGE